MPQGRVQTAPLQGDIRLRPAPVQSDTYAPPPRPTPNHNLARLESALASFAGTVGGLVPLVDRQSEEAEKNALWAAQKRLSGLTREEYVAAVEGRQIPAHADKFSAQAIQGAHGLEFGAHRADEVRQHLQTAFDWDGGDPDQYIVGVIRADMDKYGGDRNFGAQYLRQMESARNWALDYAEKRKTGQFVKAQGDAAFGVIDTKVDELLRANAEPEAIAKAVFGWYADLGKDGTLGVDSDRLDLEVLNKARRIAAQHPETAIALLDANRSGRGGQSLSLSTKPEMRDEVMQIRGTATDAINARLEADFRDAITAEDAALLEDGNLDAVGDIRFLGPDGKERTISANERREAAKDIYLRKSVGIAERNRETPAETSIREFRAFRLSGEKHPALEAAVKGIADLGVEASLVDEGAFAKLAAKVKAYEWMQNESTNSLLAYTDEKDRDFAETALMAVRYLATPDGRKFSLEDGIRFAIKASQVSKEGAPSAAAREDIERAVKKLSSEPGWIYGTKDAPPQNWSRAYQRVQVLANRFVATGVEPEKAVKFAAAAVKRTSVLYNGVLLDLQNYDLPEEFEQEVDEVIRVFAEDNPSILERSGLSRKDISIEIARGSTGGGGQLMLIDKETLLPVLDEKGNAQYFNLAKLRAASKVKTTTRIEKKARDAVFASSAKARGLRQAIDNDGKAYWIDPDTREVFDFTFGPKDQTPKWKKTGRRYKRAVAVDVGGGLILNKRAREGIEGANNLIDKAVDGIEYVGRGAASAIHTAIKQLPEVKVNGTSLNPPRKPRAKQ